MDGGEEDGSRECKDMNAKQENGPIHEDEDPCTMDAYEDGHANNLIEDEVKWNNS